MIVNRSFISLFLVVIFGLMILPEVIGNPLIDANVQEYQEFPEEFHTDHSIKSERVMGRNRQATTHEKWLFGVFILQFIWLAYVRIASSKELNDLKRGFLNTNIAQQLHREQELSMPLSAVVFNVNFVISVGVCIFLVSELNNWIGNWEPFIAFLFICWIVMITYAIKFASLMFVSVVFPFKWQVDNYNFNFFLVQKVLGILLIPINLLIWLAPSIEYFAVIVALGTIFGGVILTAIKGFSIGSSYFTRYKLHFLLYICTLEIAPLVLLLKWIQYWI